MVTVGSNNGTAIEAALINGNLELVILADPNVQGASFQIPRICS
jgi:hypothetical protein